MSAISLDELLSELASAKFLVSNLFQTDAGVWRCNVRSKDQAWDYYEHPNPTAAVRGAIALALHQAGVPLRKNRPRAIIVPSMSGDDLLQQLGL